MCPRVAQGSVGHVVPTVPLQVDLKGLCELAHVGSFGKRSAVRSSDDFSLSHFHQSEADEVGDVDSVGDMNVDTNGVHLATGHNGSQFNQVVGGFFMIPNTGRATIEGSIPR
jgi:hypothetical protein